MLPLQVTAEQHEGRRSPSPQLRTSQASVHTSRAPAVSVLLHNVRGYVAVRIRLLHTEHSTGHQLHEEACDAATAAAVPAPLTLQQLQDELAATVYHAEQRHKERCSQAWRSGAASMHMLSPSSHLTDSSSAVSTAMSMVSLLARVLLPRSTHMPPGARPQAAEQDRVISLGLKLPATRSMPAHACTKEDSTDRSSFSERAPMPHTPNMAAHVPPFPPLHAAVAAPESPHAGTARATSPDHLRGPLSPLASMHHPTVSLQTPERLPCNNNTATYVGNVTTDAAVSGDGDDVAGGYKTADARLHLSPFAHPGAAPTALSRESSLVSPRGQTSLVSQGSGCTLATEDSAAFGSPKEGGDVGGCTAWSADLGVSPAEWLAALAMVPHLPRLLQHKLDALTCQQVCSRKDVFSIVWEA